MAERPFDDLDGLGREIDRLWAKVASSSVDVDAPLAPPASDDSSPSKVLAWEAVSLLKRQHRDESRGWSELLEAKEQALRAARERVALLASQNAQLSQAAREAERQLLEKTLQTQAQLDAAVESFSGEQKQREDETRALRALLEQTRQRLGAQEAAAKAERREWDKKEQQFLLDLRELRELTTRYQEQSAGSADEARRYGDGLKEAKNALEKTLAELLRERQVRAETEQEREKALKKVDEVEGHLKELSKLWEEERAQWRELWDRERSTWETQRQEFATWEQRLRQEREAWHAELQAKEKDQLRFTDEMTRTLRETTALTDRLRAEPRGRVRLSGRVVGAALVALALAAGAPRLVSYARQRHLKPVAADAVTVSGPTALAFDGTMAWMATWEGRLLAYDPQNLAAAARTAAPTELAPYHPVALAFGNGMAWTLDSARARVVRHSASDPAKVLATRPAPGPSPTALAFDGQALWSYDAVNRELYEHGVDEGTVKAYTLPIEGVVAAMCWVGERLWAYDAKARQLVELEFKDGQFRAAKRSPLNEPVISLAAGSAIVDGKRRPQLWALVGPGGARSGNAVIRYDY